MTTDILDVLSTRGISQTGHLKWTHLEVVAFTSASWFSYDQRPLRILGGKSFERSGYLCTQ